MYITFVESNVGVYHVLLVIIQQSVLTHCYTMLLDLKFHWLHFLCEECMYIPFLFYRKNP